MEEESAKQLEMQEDADRREDSEEVSDRRHLYALGGLFFSVQESIKGAVQSEVLRRKQIPRVHQQCCHLPCEQVPHMDEKI
jgi:hypothetical protein